MPRSADRTHFVAVPPHYLFSRDRFCTRTYLSELACPDWFFNNFELQSPSDDSKCTDLLIVSLKKTVGRVLEARLELL